MAPKLEVDNATENAKKIANIKQNNTIGFEIIDLIDTMGFLKRTYRAKNKMTLFSIPEINITGFFASQRNGLNKPVIVAIGNFEINPNKVGSIFPRSKEFP